MFFAIFGCFADPFALVDCFSLQLSNEVVYVKLFRFFLRVLIELSERLNECLVRVVDFKALNLSLLLSTPTVLPHQLGTGFALSLVAQLLAVMATSKRSVAFLVT